MVAVGEGEQLTLRVGSLFSGIGGIDLGLERAGFTITWQCEKDPWCRKILTKHWPEVPKYEDVQTLDAQTVEPVDLLAGGFPCQDLSVAGKQAGLKEGTRSGLWFEFARLIRALRPRYVLVENVSGILANHALGRVLGDLAECGYDSEWDCISASSIGAPHPRERYWVCAYPASLGSPEGPQFFRVLPETIGRNRGAWNGRRVDQPGILRMAYGVSHRVDRLRGLGNSVVPQIVQWIGQQIMNVHTGGEEG